MLRKSRNKSHEGTSRNRIHQSEHEYESCHQERLRERFLQVNEQQCLWENHGECEKLCEHSPGYMKTHCQQTSNKTKFRQEHDIL